MTFVTTPASTTSRSPAPARTRQLFGLDFVDDVSVDATVDVERTYADWFAGHGVSVALQRPDFHLYGTAVTVDDARALVADLRAALTEPTRSSSPTSHGGSS